MTSSRVLTVLLAALSSVASAAAPAPAKHFTIRVVDEATGRGVPLVELRTVHSVRHFTDSNGVAAFHEPGLMGRRVFFHVNSHGYQFPKDGFGYRGKALGVTPGGSATLRIRARVSWASSQVATYGGRPPMRATRAAAACQPTR